MTKDAKKENSKKRKEAKFPACQISALNENTDLIAPGAVQIADQTPVVVNHTIKNFKMSHFTLR